MRKQLAALVLAGSAVAGLLGAPSAHAATTTTTFALTAGSLSVSTPASSSLSSAATGASAISASLGAVTVTDARGALAGTWSASASSTDFTTGLASADETIGKANVSYLAPLPTVASGTVVAATSGAQILDQARVVVTAASIVGNNSVNWNPTITVTLPSDSVAGTYSGTLTHSIA